MLWGFSQLLGIKNVSICERLNTKRIHNFE